MTTSPAASEPPDDDRGPEGKFLLSHCRPILRATGFRPRRSLGQNFLADPNTLRFIARAAECRSGDRILEIGAGMGLLTQYLADAADQVHAVEVDRILFDVAVRMLAPLPNVHLIRGDILSGKQEVDRQILQGIPDPPPSGGSIVHVSNLPYSVAVPILVGLLEGEPRMERMVVMVQREIAERILAPPGTRSYGAYTILLRLQVEVEMIRKVPSGAFWPVPEVQSVILRIRRREPPPDLHDYSPFKRFLRGLFTLRRKSLLRGLCDNPSGPISEEAARWAIGEVGAATSDRAEGLDPEAILALFRLLSGKEAAPPGSAS